MNGHLASTLARTGKTHTETHAPGTPNSQGTVGTTTPSLPTSPQGRTAALVVVGQFLMTANLRTLMHGRNTMNLFKHKKNLKLPRVLTQQVLPPTGTETVAPSMI